MGAHGGKPEVQALRALRAAQDRLTRGLQVRMSGPLAPAYRNEIAARTVWHVTDGISCWIAQRRDLMLIRPNCLAKTV